MSPKKKVKTKKSEAPNWKWVAYNVACGDIIASEGPIIATEENLFFPEKGNRYWTEYPNCAQYKTGRISAPRLTEDMQEDLCADGVMSWPAFVKHYPEFNPLTPPKRKSGKPGRIPKDETEEPLFF